MDKSEKSIAKDSLPDKKGISTAGLGILGSMDAVASGGADPDAETPAGYEKPGYTLCAYVERFIDSPAGPVPVVRTALGKDDLFSTFYVRCGIRRFRYRVSPGVYAVGNPGMDSDVLVTANFKLTFDTLRKALGRHQRLDFGSGYPGDQCLVCCRERDLFDPGAGQKNHRPPS